MAASELRSGEVAEFTGVSLDTLRYHERRHLLPRARRTQGGFRLFTSETVQRVSFIKHAQELGFSLEEIRELLSPGSATHSEVGVTSSSFFELGQSFDYRSIIINTLTFMPLVTCLLSLYFLT